VKGSSLRAPAISAQYNDHYLEEDERPFCRPEQDVCFGHSIDGNDIGRLFDEQARTYSPPCFNDSVYTGSSLFQSEYSPATVLLDPQHELHGYTALFEFLDNSSFTEPEPERQVPDQDLPIDYNLNSIGDSPLDLGPPKSLHAGFEIDGSHIPLDAAWDVTTLDFPAHVAASDGVEPPMMHPYSQAQLGCSPTLTCMEALSRSSTSPTTDMTCPLPITPAMSASARIPIERLKHYSCGNCPNIITDKSRFT